MALQSDGADTSYLNTASTISSTNFWFTAIFKVDTDDPAGEADLFTIYDASPFNYFSVRADIFGSTREDLRIAGTSAYEALTGTAGNSADWFGLGIACSGTGATDLIITVMTTSVATPVTFLRQMDGGTWTPDYLRLFMGLQRGAAASVQNFKYGDGYRSATQLQDEMWTTTNVHTAGTPVLIPMVSGTVATQRGALSEAGVISAVVGPLDTSGGGAPTVTISAAGVSGEKFTISGTYTGTGGGLTLNIQDRIGTTVSQTIVPTFSAGTFSTAFRALESGSHVLRAVITDSNGTANADSSALTAVYAVGSDELPYTWDVTSLTINPASVTVEVGATAPVVVRDQASNVIRGATVTVPAIASVTTTDIDGRAFITGVSVGTGQITASALNQAGATVSANAALAVTAATGATVTVSPATATAGVGETVDFDATVVGSTLGVTWSITSGTGSIDGDGNYVTTTPGTAVIRATSVEFPGSYSEATLTISDSVDPTGFVASFLSDATQSAQVGAVVVYTMAVRRNNFPIAGATITATASQSQSTLGIVNATTDSNGRGSVQLTVGDGSPVDTTIVLTFTISDGTSESVLTGYLQILSELYGATELRGVSYARPRPRNE